MIEKTCGHPDIPSGTPLTPDICGVCWLWANRPQFRDPSLTAPNDLPMRPCIFENANHCRMCWLWFNSPKHREAWEKLPVFDAAQLQTKISAKGKRKPCPCGKKQNPIMTTNPPITSHQHKV